MKTGEYAGDLYMEIKKMLDRFQTHPEEIEEKLPEINRLIFGKTEYTTETAPVLDFLVVTGSPNCKYRVQKALEAGAGNPEAFYIVSGGNLHKSGVVTEAEFMAGYLSRHSLRLARPVSGQSHHVGRGNGVG